MGRRLGDADEAIQSNHKTENRLRMHCVRSSNENRDQKGGLNSKLSIRISTGAFKSTPFANLQVLVNEKPLELRRQDLLLRYFYKLKCHVQNPAYSSIVNTRLEGFFRSRNYVTIPIIKRLRQAIERYNIPTKPVLPYATPCEYS